MDRPCIVAVLLGLAAASQAATYYIDYDGGDDANAGTSTGAAWQRAPGMEGFAGSYTHSPGDTFVFRGGVTWPAACFQFDYAYSGGGSDQRDVFTFDAAWYSGDSWTQPTWSGGGTFTNSNDIMIDLSGAAWVTLDNIRIVDVGVTGGFYDVSAIRCNPTGEGLVLQRLTVIPYSRHCLVLNYGGTSPVTNGFQVLNCDLSAAANFIELGINVDSPAATNWIDNITITGNRIHDPGVQLLNGDHGDGIHLFNAGAYDDRLLRDVTVARNTFDGDWGGADTNTSNTAQVYFEDVVYSAVIENNVFSFSNTNNLRDAYLFSPGMIAVSASNIVIRNNTIDCSALPGTTSDGAVAGIHVGETRTADIRGNIVRDCRIAIRLEEPIESGICDYNVVEMPGTLGQYYAVFDNSGPAQEFEPTLAGWQAHGHGLNSLSTSVTFEAVSGFAWAWAAGQPMDGILPARLTTLDRVGRVRPTTGASDAGAWELNGLRSAPDHPPLRLWMGVPQ